MSVFVWPLQIGELEQQLSSQVLEFERASEELQNITDEVETLREELGFREHQVGELERTLAREREAATRSEGEVQVGRQWQQLVNSSVCVSLVTMPFLLLEKVAVTRLCVCVCGVGWGKYRQRLS